MKKKKILILSCIIIILLLLLVVAIKLGIDYSMEAKIRKEVSLITKMYDVNNNEDVSSIIDRTIVKKSRYKKVEEAIKSYYKDIHTSLENLNFLLDTDNQYNYLSADNINSDDSLFTKSKDNISNMKAQINENFKLFNKYLDDEDIKLSYVADKKLTKYYIDFYLDVIGSVDVTNFKDELNKKCNKVINNLDTYGEALDYLVAHKGKWSIKENNITFKKNEYLDEFNNIISNIVK